MKMNCQASVWQRHGGIQLLIKHIMWAPQYFIIMTLGTQIATAALETEYMLWKFHADCMNLWHLDSVIFISDKDHPVNTPQQDVSFQWFTAFHDLETIADYEDMNIMVFSLIPMRESDLTLLSRLLFRGITILLPLNSRILGSMKLRLDSRQDLAKYPGVSIHNRIVTAGYTSTRGRKMRRHYTRRMP